MGQAKKRGTPEQRKQLAVEKRKKEMQKQPKRQATQKVSQITLLAAMMSLYSKGGL